MAHQWPTYRGGLAYSGLLGKLPLLLFTSFDLRQSSNHFGLASDVVSGEHRVGLVARDHLSNIPVNPALDHIADRRPAEIVNEHIALDSCLLHDCPPQLAKITHRALRAFFQSR